MYKRDVEEKYSLKMKASRAFFSEVNARFPTLPFTLRAGDEKQWRLGVTECVKHGLFTEYPVLYEKADAIIAHVKFTALLLPSGNVVRLDVGAAAERDERKEARGRGDQRHPRAVDRREEEEEGEQEEEEGGRRRGRRRRRRDQRGRRVSVERRSSASQEYVVRALAAPPPCFSQDKNTTVICLPLNSTHSRRLALPHANIRR